MSIKRAFILSSIERYYGFIVALVTTIIVSRLLSPAEVGQFSVAMAVAGLALSLKELGVSSFLIRTAQLDPAHLRLGFGLSLTLSATLGLIVLALSGPFGQFFDSAEVTALIRIVSINFFVLPLGTVNFAMIQRAMRFDLSARIGVFATTCSLVVTIYLAANDHGAASLAWGSVALSVATVAATLYLTPEQRFVRPQLKGARDIVSFGGQTTVSTVIADLNARLPEFMLGRVDSLTSAGLYSRAGGLNQNLNDLIQRGAQPVVLPYFASIQRAGGDAIAAYWRLSMLVVGIGWPAYALLAALAEPLTLVLFGEKWLGIVDPLRILACNGALALLFSFQYQLVLVRNLQYRQMMLGLCFFPVRVVLIYIGSRYGATGVACGMLSSTVLFILVSAGVLYPQLGLSFGGYVRLALRNLPLFVLPLVAVVLVLRFAAHQGGVGPLVSVLMGGAIAGLVTLLVLSVTRHAVYQEVMALLQRRRA
jgi:O-antigen/teichoic acid export membrane protein